jgi:integrase
MKCLRPGCASTLRPRPQNRGTQKVCRRPECKAWYKRHWSQIATAPRGIEVSQWARIERRLDLLRCGFDGMATVMGALVISARETGLRLSELLGLTWRDVWTGTKVLPLVVIRGQRTPKGFKVPKMKRARHGFFSVKARGWIARVRGLAKMKGGGKPDQWVFPVSHGYAWEWWKNLQRGLAIVNSATRQGYRFHDLRHTIGTELVRAGRPELAKEMLGHADLATTMRYAKQNPEDVGRQIEKARADLAEREGGG